MPGAFEASAEFEDDPLATADELQNSAGETPAWLEAVATSTEPWAVDFKLVKEIHFRWFESTFPADAGVFRTQMVLNRKGSAVEVEAVAEANTLTVRVYDVHPFIDGNTRADWHLRNYLLMLDGLPPLDNLVDPDRYMTAWWAATAEEHDDRRDQRTDRSRRLLTLSGSIEAHRPPLRARPGSASC